MTAWAIIRYAAGSGWAPEADCAAFDGWYVDKADAARVYRDWCAAHPNWIVALVSADQGDIRFSEADWSRVVPPQVSTLCPLKPESHDLSPNP